MTAHKLTINKTKNKIICNELFSWKNSYLGGFGVANHKPYAKFEILHGGWNHASTVSGSHAAAATK